MLAGLCSALLGWAVYLGGYEQPETCPYVLDRGSEWMLDHSGVNTAYGWYPGNGHVVYVDLQALEAHSIGYRNGVIVHEIVHHLQWLNGDLNARSSCEERVQAERYAYYVQREFMTQIGNPEPVGVASMHMVCIGEE